MTAFWPEPTPTLRIWHGVPSWAGGPSSTRRTSAQLLGGGRNRRGRAAHGIRPSSRREADRHGPAAFRTGRRGGHALGHATRSLAAGEGQLGGRRGGHGGVGANGFSACAV